jgi:hypothetical protein
VNNERKWSPRRAYDLRLDRAAREASQAIKLCGAHTDAAERFLRRLVDFLDSDKTSSGSNTPPRAA